MRITILSGSVPTTTFIDALINTMAEEGYEITVIGKRVGDASYRAGVHTIIVPGNTLQRLLLIVQLMLATGFKHVDKIWKAGNGIKAFYNNLLFYLPIIKSKPDKIHLQWAAFVHNRSLLFDLYPGKILVSMRGAHINYTPLTTPAIKESYLHLFPFVHRFHAVSKAIATESLQYKVDAAKTDIIYSFVADDLLNKKIAVKDLREKLHIISVGRFFWKKGYEYALDALGILKQKGILFTYTLIAEGETPAGITYQMHQAGLTGCVTIVNGASHADVLQQIEKHDVLLLPSVEEGIANVVLEAMALGTPVITTCAGGMKETIDDGFSGFVVPVRDARAIAEVLEQFSSLEKERRFVIARNAKTKVQEQHNKQQFVELFRKFYNS